MKEKMMQRKNTERKLSYCDFVRTVLMISVVLGHSMDLWMGNWFNQTPIEENNLIRVLAIWINSFHIYAFAMLSGYLFFYLKFESGKYNNGYFDFIQNKVKRLLVPYVFAMVIWVAPIYAYFYKADWSTLIKRFVLCEGPSQLWFLIMLFGVFIVFYPLADFFKSHTHVGVIVMMALFGISLIGDHLFPNYFQIWTVCGYVPFFGMGFLIRKREQDVKIFKLPIWFYVFVDAILLIVYLGLMKCEGTLFRVVFYCEGFLLHMVGAILAFRVLEYIGKRINLDNKIYQMLKTSSMGIYLFHQQFIFFIVDGLNGKLNPWLIVIISFFVSFVLSLIITQILNKYRITRKLIGSN